MGTQPGLVAQCKWLAYWSDESGENEIWLRDNSTSQAKKITDFGKGMGWNLSWSPDSKKIVFINDLQEIKVLTIADRSVETIDHTTDQTYGALQGFYANWSPDSKWLTYSKGTENLNNAIYLYSIENKKLHQATSAYYNDANPVFDHTGKYLFFTTDRSFNPSYSNFDNTWIYPNSTQLAVATLDPSTPAMLFAKNDEIKMDTASASKENKDKAPADTAKKAPPKTATASNKVDPATLERRLEILPVPPGNIGGLSAVDGKLIYMRFPNTGAAQVGKLH
jgi:tricorn protease